MRPDLAGYDAATPFRNEFARPCPSFDAPLCMTSGQEALRTTHTDSAFLLLKQRLKLYLLYELYDMRSESGVQILLFLESR